MEWLAKWIKENVEGARVLVITDRTELDDQIEMVFKRVDEQIFRTKSGDDLISALNRREEWLIGSLVHKFGRQGDASEEKAMKAILPNASFIGFTGAPLLKTDKRTTMEVFGTFIGEYRFDEAIEDEVVLDLHYDPRDMDQNVSSQDKVDQWFDAKTLRLTASAKAQIKLRWGTMQKLLSQPRAVGRDRQRHCVGYEYQAASGEWSRQCDAGLLQHF